MHFEYSVGGQMSQLCCEHTRTLMLGYVFDSAKGSRIIDL
jgi:hypothetical protein